MLTTFPEFSIKWTKVSNLKIAYWNIVWAFDYYVVTLGPYLDSYFAWILEVLTYKLGYEVAWLCEGTTHPPSATIWKQYRTCSQVVGMIGQCYRHNLTKLCLKNFQDPKYFGTKNFSRPKIYQDPKFFRDQKFFRTKNFSGPRIFQDLEFSGPKIFQDPKFFGTQNF